MPEETIAIELPQPLYQKLRRLSELMQRPVESLVLQTLDANVPPLPEDLPEEMRQTLLALEALSDEALWEAAQKTISLEEQERYRLLLEKKTLDQLTETEKQELDNLTERSNQLMLSKAYAYLLLKWRGYSLPTLNDLEAQI